VPISRPYTVEEDARTEGLRFQSDYPDCKIQTTTDLRDNAKSHAYYLEVRKQELSLLEQGVNQ
jgi:hypothetical protein